MVGPETLSARYRLEERLAGGAMGTVYAARDERLGRRVAVKLLKEELAEDPHFVERFRREARSVAALEHPNIASVFDYGEDDGRHYIVMELVDGRDLARLLREEGRPSVERARRFVTQTCDALGHAHAAGVVHRDVKPANVIVGQEDRVKVTDFGIARAPGDATLTAAGSVLGTARYISPEQASDGRVGPASDVYSAGIVLFELLTGTVPFTGDSAVSLALQHVNENVPAPSSMNPGVPAELDRIVARATAKDPGHRYSDGAEMASGLRGREPPATRVMGGIAAPTAVLASGAQPGPALGGSTDPMAQVVWPPGAATGARRWGTALAVVLVVLLAVAGGLLAMTLLNDDEPRPRRRGGASAPQETPTPTPTPTETPPPEPEEVTVPSGLVGSNVDDAAGVLTEAGLVPAREDVPSQDDEGIVIGADPPEGTLVAPNSTVTLTVSTGAPAEETPGGSPDAGNSGSGDGDEGED